MRVLDDKDSDIRYTISKGKFVLGQVTIDGNFYPSSISNIFEDLKNKIITLYNDVEVSYYSLQTL